MFLSSFGLPTEEQASHEPLDAKEAPRRDEAGVLCNEPIKSSSDECNEWLVLGRDTPLKGDMDEAEGKWKKKVSLIDVVLGRLGNTVEPYVSGRGSDVVT
jgi:hypothetical protein